MNECMNRFNFKRVNYLACSPVLFSDLCLNDHIKCAKSDLQKVTSTLYNKTHNGHSNV